MSISLEKPPSFGSIAYKGCSQVSLFSQAMSGDKKQSFYAHFAAKLAMSTTDYTYALLMMRLI
ncbi:hypothetical protein [Nostoc sp. DedQUE07]|uniref:hypothetical protein n=1 Tax=Nostoc sp. DedQUE07 TaxID=3075392 RepID=UPI002AD49363|nr:hypothetical protein [Nostoc sp. DedQUE07]